MDETQLKARKAPRQARSLATVEVILAAAARVLSRESLAGFNTNRVAEVAGVSVGSVYQYFPNKAALVVALIEREQARLAEGLEAAVASVSDAPLLEGLSRLARLAIEQQFQDPVFAAALDHEERRLPLGTRLASSESRLVGAILKFLEDHRDELIPFPDGSPEEVARDLLLITRVLVEADAYGGQGAPTSLRLTGSPEWREPGCLTPQPARRRRQCASFRVTTPANTRWSHRMAEESGVSTRTPTARSLCSEDSRAPARKLRRQGRDRFPLSGLELKRIPASMAPKRGLQVPRPRR
jgi:AcrR family transcriptional regulator